MNGSINLSSTRARQARYAARLKDGTVLLILMLASAAAALTGIIIKQPRVTYLAVAALGVSLMFKVWQRYALKKIAPKNPPKSLDDILDQGLLGKLSKNSLTPLGLWRVASKDWQGMFILNHLGIGASAFENAWPDSPEGTESVWQEAARLQQKSEATLLGAGNVVAALLLSSQPAVDYLAKLSIKPEDVIQVHDWLQRVVNYINAPRPYYGGIGRDWATGFTPTLERFSSNISDEVQAGRSHFHFLADSQMLDTIVHGLSQGTGAVALVGDYGAGKTSMAYALAQRLLEGHDQDLRYYKIVSLNASLILSDKSGGLERLMLMLFSEAVRSGNMILFLDEAQLFFGEGMGALNIAQVLQPILQNRRLKIIAAFTPTEFQRLKQQEGGLAGAFTSVVMQQPPKEDTMKILEDSALTLSNKANVLVTLPALKETYRLADQHISEQAFPGKAITLLEQASPFAVNGIVTEASVQTALEKAHGIKAGKAQVTESADLLNLEAKIHERMVNQTRAVKVVSDALRRSRAGVANPNRPIGGFLFLGPTGVGKTELARSLAATYFGDERQMVRLDMSEFQNASDVNRLLDDGASGESFLLQMRKQPFSVVLLDEIEKAHPNVLNLLLQLLDEGQLTDVGGRKATFRNAIVIATSNAGAVDIIQQLQAGSSLEEFERPLIDKLIAEGKFKPELINRFDEVVLFRPLTQEELKQVAKIMLDGVNKTLADQNISVQLTEPALDKIVRLGYDPQFGSRPMRHVIQKTVENVVAVKILEGSSAPGSVLTLDEADIADN